MPTDSGTTRVDEPRFDELIAPHLATLFRVACRLTGSASDAQDLVQDTCIAACEHPAALGAAAQPLHWLLRVLNNRFIDGVRRRRRSPLVALDEASGPAHFASQTPGPEELLQQSDAERQLERAFRQLDDMQRTLLSLRAEGYGLTEIEAITGIGREVLRARLHRARRSLAARLHEQVGTDAPVSALGSKP